MTKLNRLVIILASLVLGFGGFSGCGKESLESRTRTINGKEFEFSQDKVVQKTRDIDNIAKLGVMSDFHGYSSNAREISENFKKQGVEGIVMLGDYAQHFRTKPDSRLTDYNEITACIEEAAKTSLPLYVIPGNHDLKKDYTKAIAILSKKYSNIIDMSRIRSVEGDDFNFVSAPLGRGFTYPVGGFIGNEEQLDFVQYALQMTNGYKTILLTHQPRKCSKRNGIDVISTGENVGDFVKRKGMEEAKIDSSFSGDIHEAGGRGINSQDVSVPENVFSESLSYNPGAVCPWQYLNGKNRRAMAGIVTIENNKIKYENVLLN